jgi:hypothetical protein
LYQLLMCLLLLLLPRSGSGKVGACGHTRLLLRLLLLLLPLLGVAACF